MKNSYDKYVEYARPDDILKIVEQVESECSYKELMDFNNKDLNASQQEAFRKALSIVIKRLSAAKDFPRKSHNQQDFLVDFIDDTSDELQIDAALAASRVIENIAKKVIKV